jgi:sterol desaturase/sphingolipid hydroxylase (fatty acid hydroxylase superfamily)
VTLLTIQPPDAKPLLALSVLVLLLVWETIYPFFPFPKGGKRLSHGVRNVFLGLINGLITTLVFVGLWWWAAAWTEQNGFGLLHWMSLPAWTEWFAAILMLDAWTYYWHRINHRIPFLWRFHRVHHSDPHMDVTTASRFHIGEIVMSSVLRVPLIILLGVGIDQLALYELFMFAVVQFHHANIGVTEKWDRFLRLFIVTPYMHKVHHSRWQPETDSNYSSLLSIWDRLFSSFRINDKPETIRLGLDEFSSPLDQTVPGMLRTPLATRKPTRHGKQ